MNKGRLVVIVAPSGSGKSTLIKRLKEDFPNLEESVSFTTRPKRVGDKDGVHYHFITEQDFEERIENNDFLEYARVHGNYYGTSKSFVEKKRDEGRDILFDLDVQGADSFKKYFGEEAQTIFIAPPSFDELESRLRGRGTDSEEVILRRLANAKLELERQNDYDYLVVNDNLEHCFLELREVFGKILKR